MANANLASTRQHRLKQLCRVIYYSSVLFLVFLYIYVYWGHFNSTLEIKRQEKKESRGFPQQQPTSNTNITCSDNTFQKRDGCQPCPNGTFSFPGWKECKPFLNCTEIALQVHPRKRIPRGVMKEKWLAEWNGHRVVYVNCSRPSAKPQCTRGMTRMEKLQGPYVTRLIGRCYENLKIVTMFYKHGAPKYLGQLFRKPQYFHYNNIQTRFQLIVDYVKIMNYMHNSPIGIRVMCDTGNMGKLLSQYLITDDFHMVVNDLDNTPDVRDGNGMLCNSAKRKGSGQWFAPEQRWPYRPGVMPKNDEKVEIWRIPAIVQKLLGGVDGSSFVESKLERVMKRCQATDPKKRPSANEVLQELLRVQRLIPHEQ